MQIVIEDGIPVLVSRRDAPRNRERIRDKRHASAPLQSKMGKIKYDEQVALTLRQREAVSNYLSGNMTKKDACEKAGFKSVAPLNIAMEKLSKNESFVAEMERQGLTDKFIVSTIKEGMEAEHPMAKPDENGKRPKDYHAIEKFTGRAMQAKDVLPSQKLKVESESKHIHIHMTPDDARAIQEYNRMRGKT